MTDREKTTLPGVSRRGLLLGAAAGAGALALGAGGLTSAATFVKGADLSWMPQMEAAGYYRNNSAGQRQDLFTILKGYGITAVSLRTWVNPSNSPTSGHCGIAETARMAARCRDAGLQVLLGFHLGDTWNSVGTQNPPAGWKNMSYPQMRDALRSYVNNALNTLKAAGVTPGWGKISNETNGGVCRPVGSLRNPSQMTGLLNNMRNIQSTWSKPVMQVEYGGPVNKANQVRDSLRQLITGLKGFGGLGCFFWQPEGYPSFSGYQSSAWDQNTRRPTAAMDGFLNV